MSCLRPFINFGNTVGAHAHSSMQTGMREAAFIVQTMPSSVVQTLWTHSYISVFFFSHSLLDLHTFAFVHFSQYILHLRLASSFSFEVTLGFRA